jgi:hypothetical protein
MVTVEKQKVGRPLKHVTSTQKKVANASAARQYRARQKAKKLERRDLSKSPRSSIIDLGAVVPPWRTKRPD